MYILNTEYTKSGNGYFLAYIPSRRVKSSQGGGERPSPFTISTITYNVVVYGGYGPAERSDTLTQILLYPDIYSVVLDVAGK
jgi:hypothetical protein